MLSASSNFPCRRTKYVGLFNAVFHEVWHIRPKFGRPGKRKAKMDDLAEFFTVRDVSQMLRVWPETVRGWLAQGKLKGLKLPGGDWRIRPQDFEEMLKAPARLVDTP